MSAVGRVLAVLALTATSGCAATGVVHESSRSMVPLASYAAVRLHVSSEADGVKPEDLQIVEAKLFVRVKSAGVFQRVLLPQEADEADLDLNVQVLEIDHVSTTQRAWIGGLAGRANLRLDVRLDEVASGRRVGLLIAEGKSEVVPLF